MHAAMIAGLSSDTRPINLAKHIYWHGSLRDGYEKGLLRTTCRLR